MALTDYRRKRDFHKTAEPKPLVKGASKEKEGEAFFVIQKHAASHLHYDFRLAMGGVLASWALPKGVPFAKGEKRLAVHVEDHPIDYAQFEGIIPEGEYGGGTVMVWDIGHYVVSGGAPEKALKEGKLHLFLYGHKLEGEWTLVRAPSLSGPKEQWLLIKTGASVRPVGKRRDDQSVLTQRTMRQIAAAQDAEWHSSHPGETRAGKPVASKEKPQKLPKFIPPMKAKLVKRLPSGEDWVYEVKFDGYRAMALKGGSEVKLISRNEKPLVFPELTEAVARLPCRSALLDGEIVALDQAGRPSFQLLQNRGKGALIHFYLFDLLSLDGEDLRSLPLRERKARLKWLLREAEDPLRFSADLPGNAATVLKQIVQHGLEGVIAKRAESPYESGQRSGAWQKIKCINEQEFVIGGYTAPKGARQHFGALLVGYYEAGKFRFAGKVGTGFDDKSLRMLFHKLQEGRVEKCPFIDPPLTPAERKRCTWVKPEWVCQLKFSEWTDEMRLRQPVFLGLREDKAANEVSREG